jgi:hypothetical protein
MRRSVRSGLRIGIGWLLGVFGCSRLAFAIARLAAQVVAIDYLIGVGALIGVALSLVYVCLGASVRNGSHTMTRRWIAGLMVMHGIGNMYEWVTARFATPALYLAVLAILWLASAAGVWRARQWARRALSFLALWMCALSVLTSCIYLSVDRFDLGSDPLAWPWQLSVLSSIALWLGVAYYALNPATRQQFAASREEIAHASA